MSGANAGRLFAELDASDSGVTGSIGLHDEVHGVIVLTCVGRIAAGTLELTCTPPGPVMAGEPGEIRLHGLIDPEGQVSGTWTSATGAEGGFVLFPDTRR